jgi:glycosyltransferase involved in cell wall biosynthesis
MSGILHIDSERGWRGGQQQAIYLFEGLIDRGFNTAMVCKPGSELEKYCIKKDLPHFAINMRGEMDLFSARKIAKICKNKGYSILHLHSAHAVATGLWVKLFHHTLKLIGVRRVDFHIKKNPFSRFKYMSKMIERHVCISNNISKVMLEDGLPKERLVTIHSGIDLSRFDDVKPPANFKETLGIPEDHIVVGTVAALSGHKDYPNLLNAAKRVFELVDNVTFVSVGSGPDEKEIFNLKEELDLGDRFIFTGYRTDVGNFLKTFDVFVLASYLEGLGTSLLDAQVCSLPLIGCKTGGIPEVIENNVNGLLVPPRDHNALAEAIKKLVLDQDKRKTFGSAGKESVKMFSINNTISKNIDLYKTIA